MRYITGLHALNLPCALNTMGDWHASAMSWEQPLMLETEGHPLGEWGVNDVACASLGGGTYKVADTLRACLDLLLLGRFVDAQGMREDFIGTDEYDDALLDRAWSLRGVSNWAAIDAFMESEYRLAWLQYRRWREGSARVRSVLPLGEGEAAEPAGDARTALSRWMWDGGLWDLREALRLLEENWDALSDQEKADAADRLFHKGAAHAEYLLCARPDPRVEPEALRELLARVYDRLGLLMPSPDFTALRYSALADASNKHGNTITEA